MRTFDDILISEEFIHFMNKKDKESSDYWKKYIEEHPQIENEFNKAKFLCEALANNRKKRIPDKEKIKAGNTLLSRITSYEKFKNKNKSPVLKTWIKIAAAVILFTGLSIPASLYIFTKSGKNITYNEITVPSGEKSTLRLSDGTVIWLNSESKLMYPSYFRKGMREVILEGEGYFNVARKKKSGFTVITQDIKVTALGTIFNIKSYPSDDIIETTLVEGSVRFQQTGNKKSFKDIILMPNQKVVYKKSKKLTEIESISDRKIQYDNIRDTNTKLKASRIISIKNVNTNNITCWKDHLLVFDNETFEEIAVKMSRWYKIHVNINDEDLKHDRFTGKFINNETYIQVLEAIDLTTPIIYEIKNSKVDIKKEKQLN